MITKICEACTEQFETKYSFKKYCSHECTHSKLKNRKPIPCETCKKITKNPKFCSKSCFVTHNNSVRIRIKSNYTCIDCDTRVIKKGTKRCKDCHLDFIDVGNRTFGEYKYKKIDANRYAKISDVARRIYKSSNLPKHCVACHFPYHYEVCHIKDISSFSDDTLIKEINDINNLVALCPNCHWMFDNKVLDASTIKFLREVPGKIVHIKNIPVIMS